MSVRFDSSAAAQFENVNELRSYPFSDNASLVSRNGDELPENVISDLHIAVPSSGGSLEDRGDSDVARVSSVRLSPSMVSVCVVVDRGGAVVSAMSVTVSMDSFRPYFPYRMERLAGLEDSSGVITFGNFDTPAEPTTYLLDGAYICAGCMAKVHAPKLRKFVDPRSGASASGDVSIEFPNHIVAKAEGKRSVRLSLSEGSAEELVSSCAKELAVNACGATPIKSINGILPDAQGRIVLWFH